jgi:hypothetical protein
MVLGVRSVSWQGWILVIAFVAAASVVALSAVGGTSPDDFASAERADLARAALRGKTQCADIDVITLTPPMVSTLRDYRSSIVIEPVPAETWAILKTRTRLADDALAVPAIVTRDRGPSLSTRLRGALRELRDRADAERPDATPALDAAACNQ